MKKIYLIDGNAYIHRAYHALPPLTTSKGESVNAVYGFLRMMLKMLKSEKPEYIAVCFDHPSKTFRHERYPEYKANRKQIDDELKTQMPLVREAVRILNLFTVEKAGYEADDIIATLARSAERDGAETVIVSADKDALQLVNARIKVWNEMKNVVFDEEKVREKYGLVPGQLNDMFALMGDAADNVPGVRGIGEKTAVKLIQKYGSLESLLEQTATVEGKLKTTLENSRHEAEQSKQLVVLDDRVPLDILWSDCVQGPRDEKQVTEFLCRYEMTSLIKEILPGRSADICVATETPRKVAAHLIDSEKAFGDLLQAIADRKKISLDLETTGLDPFSVTIVGISIALDTDSASYIPVGHSYLGAPQQLPAAQVIAGLKPLLEDATVQKYGQNIKYDYLVLRAHGIRMKGICFDTMVASYCLNPSRTTHNLKGLALDFLGFRMTAIEALIGKGAKQVTMDTVDAIKAADYAAADAAAVLMLAERFEPELREKKLTTLFYTIEMPLVEVLAEMEYAGLKVDIPCLQELALTFNAALQKLQSDIYALAGQEFNPNSPKQLSVILFEKLQLPVIRKTKTGYCTDEEVLRQLSSRHPLPERLIEFRELQKLKSTYIDALLRMSNTATHRVHTSFNQTVTATGRLSSSEPNLQNIPVRSDYGKQIRRAFIPEKGHLLLSADYSQIDLRVLAHISNDAALLKAFREGEDIHTATAREVFSIASADTVNQNLRRMAKSINFGIVYGISPYGLAQQLKITNDEAKAYIKSYFEKYHGVAEWIETILKEARVNGQVTTLLGRIRYLPEINSTNGQIRAFAERTAMNTPIQGTSADIIKVAMIDLEKVLKEKGFRTKMLVQVHDELLFEVPEEELQDVMPLIKTGMEEAVRLSIPVVVDMKKGLNWADMEPVR